MTTYRKCKTIDCHNKPPKHKHYCQECSKEKQKRIIGGVDGYDFLTCPICLNQYKEFNLSHAKSHNFSSLESFIAHCGFRKSKCGKILERMRGSYNPWFNHGGKLSPFSNNYNHKNKHNKQDIIKKAHNTRVKNKGYNTTIEYYTSRGHSEEKAKELIAERQRTFTLEKCIAKYGEEEGTRLWQDRQDRWQATLNAKSPEEKAELNKKKGLTREQLIAKYGKIKAQEIISSRCSGIFRSKAELEIESYLRNNNLNVDVQFKIKNNKGSIYIYDFFYNDKIIEYNGDYWHANPKIYKADSLIKYPCKEPIEARLVWEGEKDKINLLNSLNYDLLIIWESDYKKNKEGVWQECLNFLNS